jgi:phosphonopyruvate decarboxylase
MSVSPEKVFENLKLLGFDFFTGVPDSLLKDFCQVLDNNSTSSNHVIAANEGNAVAIAVGHYLATGKPPLVYMQNSGIGNAINPLLSLADGEVYGIPMLVMIGWRGEPGIHDEPQHLKQGRIMSKLLESLEIPYFELEESTYAHTLIEATKLMAVRSTPVAILIKKKTFSIMPKLATNKVTMELTREEAIRDVINRLSDSAVFVSTTGMASRELWELRKEKGKGNAQDFLTVGSMGHASSIALGISIAKPNQQVVCIDGDGAAIMHMGSLAVNGQNATENFLHIVINNGAHDSVGGQPTVGQRISFCQIAEASGYRRVMSASNSKQVTDFLVEFMFNPQSSFLEIMVKPGSRADLGRPTETPRENKKVFMEGMI